MPDYTKTIIYKLINYDFPELVYVGSTTNFTKRKYNHKNAVFNDKNKGHHLKLYVSIRENGGWESWDMIKILYVIIHVITTEKQNKKKTVI